MPLESTLNRIKPVIETIIKKFEEEAIENM